MSDDVDRVLRDYILVMDQKDSDQFKVQQRNAELEGLLVSCREKLLRQDELIRARQDEKQGLIDELRERHANMASMDEEMSSLRKFIRSVRKLLVMDDAAKFSLAEVLHVLCARLEDYGVVARAYQQQSQQVQRASADWQTMLLQIESEHRKTLQVLCTESDESFRDMLASATQTVSVANSERDAALVAADASVARSTQDAKAMVENVTTEVARLRSHVDELLRESSATRDARDVAKAELSSATQTIERMRHGYGALLQTAQLAMGTVHGWAEGVMAHRGDLMESFSCVMRTSAETHMASIGEARSFVVVNESLREQLSKLSRVHASDKRRLETAKAAAVQESQVALSSSQQQVVELRQRLSAATTKEQALNEKLHDVHAQLAGIVALSEQAEERSRDAATEVHRLERLLHQRAKENGELKQLLSTLQERSAQVRQLVVDGDQRRETVETERQALCSEVTELHHELRRAKDAVEKTESALREKSAELSMAHQALHRELASMSAERDHHAQQLRRLADDHVLGEKALKASLTSAEVRAEEAEAERNRLAVDLERLTATVASLETTVSTERQGHATAAAHLNTARQRADELEATLQSLMAAKQSNVAPAGAVTPAHASVGPEKRTGSESVPGISQSPQRSSGSPASLSRTGRSSSSPASTSSSPLSSRSGDEGEEATADDIIAAIEVSMLQRAANVGEAFTRRSSGGGKLGGGAGKKCASRDYKDAEMEVVNLRKQLAAVQTACDMSVEEVAYLRQELQLSLLARPPSASTSNSNRSSQMPLR